ncbi:RluA family pseudouridine synthase [Brevibacillus sp. H7]|jgi:RluA family pseudouridine synthase|uniref:RluA family pseudouridine synthase n=1 Tax=Brevibacillus sp. H7 TaxID=3349138 RepID=UPI00382B26FE
MSQRQWMEYNVAEEDAGKTVEQIVREKMGVSGRMLQRLTRSKGIQLNRKPPFLKRQVKPGDRVSIRIADQTPQTGQAAEAIHIPLEILYEDDHLVVVNKPAGMLVHPVGPGETNTLVHALTGVHPVHRLDKHTTGAVLLAKSSYGHQLADRLLREGGIHREYTAVVCGKLERERGTIDAPIGRDPRHPTKRQVSERGDTAITHFEVVARSERSSLVRIRLETGRTHQIRVHFQHIGHPLAGDTMYGGRKMGFSRQALHARMLSFAHPLNGQPIVAEAPLPDDMKRFIRDEYKLDDEKPL